MDLDSLKTFAEDIATYKGITKNKNYEERLKEAYYYIKSLGITTREDFMKYEGLKVGAFTYGEITLLERLENEQYKQVLFDAISHYDSRVDAFNNPNYGDALASWGTLGNTPYREEYISRGMIINGLTEEEQQRHFK